MNNNTTIQITNPNQLEGFLLSIGSQCRFITFTTDTEVKMRKTNNPFLGCRKVETRNGLVNVDFTKAVIRNVAEATGINKNDIDYVPGSTWYRHIETADGKKTCLCEGNTPNTLGRKVIQYFPMKKIGESRYFLPNGKEVQYSDIEPFVQLSKPSAFKPLVITVGLENIKSITFRKVTFENDNTATGSLSDYKDIPMSLETEDEAVMVGC